jgi:hypothetical protein
MMGGEVNLWSIRPNLEMIYHRRELARCQFRWEMSIVGVLRAELAMYYSRQVIV